MNMNNMISNMSEETMFLLQYLLVGLIYIMRKFVLLTNKLENLSKTIFLAVNLVIRN